MADKKYILDRATAERKLRRMAYEIVESNVDEPALILAGIEENGVVIAKQIQRMLAEISTIKTELISISLDKRHPTSITVSNETDFNKKAIILIDDVANSGKTLLYALKPFLEFYPKKIQVLVLVERTHKAFSIRPDYVGVSLSTTIQEHIFVEVAAGEVMGAWME
ncbi:MAG: phosphoribosyltransferase [Chitinophagaceae bacterium]|nr:MAG: phosphoribosyltransferase [Chitinophagaceae bacterium]